MPKNVKILFLSEFLSQSVALYSMLAIMFTDRSGLTATQVGLLLGIFSFTTLVAEIPTGIIADKVSRKYSIIASKLILAMGVLVWLLAPNHVGYIIGMILMGISESLSSGATQAYLYDSLPDAKRDFTKYNARLWVSKMTGFLTGAGIASVLGTDYNLLLIASILLPLLGAATSLFLKPDRRHHDDSSFNLLSESARYLISSKNLIFASLFLITLKVMVDTLIEYIPLYYRDAGVGIRYVPIIFFAGNLVSVLWFWYGAAIAKFMKMADIVWFIVLLLVFVGSSFFGVVGNVLGIFWFVRFTRVLFVYEEGEIQHLYQSKFRATITSLNSMAVRLLLALTMPGLGFLAERYFGSKVLYPVLGFSVLCIAVLVLFKTRVRVTEKTLV